MIFGLQVIALCFALIMIYFAYLHYRRQEINGFEMLFWLGSWCGAVTIIIFPEIFKMFSQTIAISRAFDLAVLGGFILIIPMVYISYIRTKRLERKIEKLVREESIRKISAKNKK